MAEVKEGKMSAANKVQQKKKALLVALEASLGVVTAACKAVGVDRTTFYKYVNEDPEFKQAVEDVENVALDFAESQLFKAMKEGKEASNIFYLKTKGKRRGYVERIEQTGANGGPVESAITVTIVDSRPDKSNGATKPGD